MYILVILLVILTAGFLVLRYVKVDYNEKNHMENIQRQNKQDFYFNSFTGNNYFNSWRREKRNFVHTVKWFFEKKKTFNYEKGDFLPKNAGLNIEDYRKIINSDKDFIIWIGHNTAGRKLQGEVFLIYRVLGEKIFVTDRETRPG